MSFLLSCYSETAFQEFILPNMNNSDYSIVLDHSVFNLADDISLKLEVVEGDWRFVGISEGTHPTAKSIQQNSLIKNGDLIQVRQGDSVLSIVVMSFTPALDNFRKYQIGIPCKITIGKAGDNDIRYDFNSLVSQHHAVITIGNDGCYVTDLSRNGIFVGSRRMRDSGKLRFGECLNILGLQIIWLGNVLAVGCCDGVFESNLREIKTEKVDYLSLNSNSAPGDHPKHYFRRSPRNMPELYTETIEIEDPPQPQRSGKRPLLLTIGPSLTMAIPMLLGTMIAVINSKKGGGTTSAYMYTGIVIAVASAVIGTIWALVSLRYNNKQEKENESLRVEKYKSYLAGRDAEIREKHDRNAWCLAEIYPSVANCVNFDTNQAQLWNRNVSHADFLYYRLGIGDLPFQAKIVIPKKRFTLVDDDLANGPAMIHDRYCMLQNVPVGIDLQVKKLVGIIGNGNVDRSYEIMKVLAMQIAANNSYTDVKMAFIFNGATDQAREMWSFAKWLPHTWTEDRKTRFYATDKSEIGEVCFALANVFRARAEADSKTKKMLPHPYYIVFIENVALIENEPIAKYLLNPTDNLGLSTVLLAERYEDLPNNCVEIIENGTSFTGFYNIETGGEEMFKIAFDSISTQEAERFARCISGWEVREPESGGEIPDSLTFFDMYGISALRELNVLDRWRKNRTYESMRVPIGEKAGGALWYLDIHEKYHGPHGLIAGTTGSGKSETLQTYMLSLAVNFSPNDIAFFVIDFKGGGMANLFSTLPHMAGQISNLSGNQVHRAMVSIKSENRRRQRIFSEYGVNHIDNYTRLLKANEATIPIPHLFIIIDEFAELKREEPDFMRELISVAQVGRSLGVHLILATQKPSGTVDDNIWSNTKFRLCLRVQDKQDSNDMLHKPDAAYITQAGRCYMQVGNDEVFELFQSGWSGAEFEENASASAIEVASMRTNTGRPAVVGNHYKMVLSDQKRIEWLTVLSASLDTACSKTHLSLDSVFEEGANLEAFLGEVYGDLASKGNDYPVSRSNSMRLTDFAHALNAARQLSGDPAQQIRNAADDLTAAGKKLPEIKGKTQLSAVSDYLARIAAENGFEKRFSLWMPVLPTELYLAQLNGYEGTIFDGHAWQKHGEEWTLSVPVGLLDDPTNQAQIPLVVDIGSGGHLAVCGTAVSGKSTFLQTMLFALVNKYSPKQLNIYILDYSSRMLAVFDGLAHVGGIVFEDDADRTAKFFSMLGEIMDQRKRLLHGGSFSQYVKASSEEIPAILIVIDNYANFREKTENKFEDILISVSRDGANYGIFLAITSGGFGSAEIQNRIADNIRNVFCLEMGDKFKYGDVMRTIHFDVLPEANTKGRGLAWYGGNILEYQTALSLQAENDYDRAEKMQTTFEKMNAVWTGKRARSIPHIPELPTWGEFSSLEDFTEKIGSGEGLLPFAYRESDASIASVELSHIFTWLITGKARTGKTNLLRVLLQSASQMERSQCFVFDYGNDILRGTAADCGAVYIDDYPKSFACFKNLLALFSERNAKKRELVSAGKNETEVFEEMFRLFPPIFLFIDNIGDFTDNIYNPDPAVGSAAGFLENITEKGYLHNVYIFACANSSDIGRYSGRKIYKNLENFRTGIHLGGNAAAQRVFDFTSLPFTEQSAVTKAGIGLLPPTQFNAKIEKVVIPDARR